MRKHTSRISEAAFAARLKLGERFATSDTTWFTNIQSVLGERKLKAVRVPIGEVKGNHWAVYVVVEQT